MGKSRHDYSFRPEPRWEEGPFVPPGPLPIERSVSDWDRIDWIRYLFASSKNPIFGQTVEALEGFDDVATGMGRTFFTPSSPPYNSRSLRLQAIDDACEEKKSVAAWLNTPLRLLERLDER